MLSLTLEEVFPEKYYDLGNPQETLVFSTVTSNYFHSARYINMKRVLFGPKSSGVAKTFAAVSDIKNICPFKEHYVSH